MSTAQSTPTTYPSGDRWICSPNHPWRPGLPTPVVHPAGREIACRDGYPGGDIVAMQCDVCGHKWTMELPQ